MNELEHILLIEEKRWFATHLFFHWNGNPMIFFWPIKSFISLRTLYISITIHKYYKNQIDDAVKFNFNIKFLIFILIYKIFTKYCYDAFDNAITTLWTCCNYSSDYEATLIFINYVVTVLRLWWYIAVNA